MLPSGWKTRRRSSMTSILTSETHASSLSLLLQCCGPFSLDGPL